MCSTCHLFETSLMHLKITNEHFLACFVCLLRGLSLVFHYIHFKNFWFFFSRTQTNTISRGKRKKKQNNCQSNVAATGHGNNLLILRKENTFNKVSVSAMDFCECIVASLNLWPVMKIPDINKILMLVSFCFSCLS